MPQIGSAVGIQTLYISISKQEEAPEFVDLLQNCPQLKELQLDIKTRPTSICGTLPITHRQLRTLFLTGMALSWVISAFSVGCRLPRLTRLVLTDINAFDPTWNMWTTYPTKDQISHITHIEVQAVSELSVLTYFRPLFEAATALGTLTLSGSAVEPVLKLLTLSAPKRVDKLRFCNTIVDGTTLREYLAAIERDGGGMSGMEVWWDNCPNFSYPGASGVLNL